MYDETSGKFFWMVPKQGRNIYKPAGTVDFRGYRSIKYAGLTLYLHRVAWLYMKKEWPPMDVGFKDGNPANLRWDNLILVTKAEKQHAYRKLGDEMSKEARPVPQKVYKRATFSNAEVRLAVEEFIRGKKLVNGVYIWLS